MSDPLSIAASIAGVATAGFAVAKGLYRIADGIGSPGVEVRIYGDEIAAFSKVLSQLRTEVQSPRSPQEATKETQDLLEDTVYACDKILQPIKAILLTLSPVLERLEDNKSKLSRFGLRVQWIFSYKEKLLFYRSALNAQQRLLQTLLDLLLLQAAKQTPSQNISIFHISLQHSVEVASRALYGPRDHIPQDVHTVQSVPSLVENGPGVPSQALVPLTDRADGLQLLESRGGPDALAFTQSSPGLSAGDDDELEAMSRQIDQYLDSGGQASIMSIVHDMRIVAPRVLRLVAQQLKSHDVEHMFDHQWERRACLHEDYNFDTEKYAIPSEDPQLDLTLKVASMIKKYKSRDTLFLIYYSSHGIISD
ncbi:hypothetical protein PG999_005683 [Apiospora kogelbergensis]|uniref:Fungal N-terminal domain-containing protein n=1 Tax=Apiospora kogelbergensis TaxID=1337665 RepID=A0AAW0R2W8_9PEZI